MRVLIYESLPDIERSAFVRRVRLLLERHGHEVLVLADERTLFRSDHGQGDCCVINCSGPLSHYIVRDFRTETFVVHGYDPCTPDAPAFRQSRYRAALQSFCPDRIVVWNGIASHHRDFMRVIDELCLRDRMRFLEVAWLPQSKYIYCDPLGVNGFSSIATSSPPPLTDSQKTDLAKRLAEYRNGRPLLKKPDTIAVPLQIESDTSIENFSPFSTMQGFVDFLDKWLPAGREITIRPHPLCRNSEKLRTSRPDFHFDIGRPLHDLLAESETVVGINSTVLVEAMAFDCRVLAFGHGIFSGVPGVLTQRSLSFEEAVQRPRDYAPFLHDLLFNRQIPADTLEGLESFIVDPEPPVQDQPRRNDNSARCCRPYPLTRFIAGEARFLLGRIAKAIGVIS